MSSFGKFYGIIRECKRRITIICKNHKITLNTSDENIFFEEFTITFNKSNLVKIYQEYSVQHSEFFDSDHLKNPKAVLVFENGSKVKIPIWCCYRMVIADANLFGISIDDSKFSEPERIKKIMEVSSKIPFNEFDKFDTFADCRE